MGTINHKVRYYDSGDNKRLVFEAFGIEPQEEAPTIIADVTVVKDVVNIKLDVPNRIEASVVHRQEEIEIDGKVLTTVFDNFYDYQLDDLSFTVDSEMVFNNSNYVDYLVRKLLSNVRGPRKSTKNDSWKKIHEEEKALLAKRAGK